MTLPKWHPSPVAEVLRARSDGEPRLLTARFRMLDQQVETYEFREGRFAGPSGRCSSEIVVRVVCSFMTENPSVSFPSKANWSSTRSGSEAPISDVWAITSVLAQNLYEKPRCVSRTSLGDPVVPPE